MPRPRTIARADPVVINGVLVHPPADEAAFQALVLSIADMYGWTLAYHTHDSRRSNPGWPDLVLGHPGQARTLTVELKTDTGRVRPEQAAWLRHLAASGHEADLWRPRDLARIARILGPQREHATLPPELLETP